MAATDSEKKQLRIFEDDGVDSNERKFFATGKYWNIRNFSNRSFKVRKAVSEKKLKRMQIRSTNLHSLELYACTLELYGASVKLKRMQILLEFLLPLQFSMVALGVWTSTLCSVASVGRPYSG